MWNGTERDSTQHNKHIRRRQTHNEETNKTSQEIVQSKENIIIDRSIDQQPTAVTNDDYQHPRIAYDQVATAIALGFCLCTILERKFPDSVGLIQTLGLEEEVVVALDGDDIMVDLGDDGDNDDGDDGDASTSQGTART